MRILIEEHQYPAEKVDGIIEGLTNLRNVSGRVCVSHVGYYYNPNLQDTVFILPKVLMEDKDGEELVFGHCKPEDIIDIQNQDVLSNAEVDFIYKLSVWVYRAIAVYRDAHPESHVVLQQLAQQMAAARKHRCNTFLDILLALQRFNKENQDFFFFNVKNIHSGHNKVNWTRTISHSQAFIQDGTPIYFNPVNKKRKINFDEELLVIYFSILNYIKIAYGFPVELNINFELITGGEFEHYLKGMGRSRLLQIKYKYFSDKALYLWELCFAFFDQARKVNVDTTQREYLLVSNFNIVFEAIIDELVGTDRSKLPQGLADQTDGKIVDHLWVDEVLMPSQEQRSVYYIGDSKYYKRSTPVGENSIYKQYTYARNVIQWSWDNLTNPSVDEKYKIRLRDDRTEGYNIIPNFFISGKVDFKRLDYINDNLEPHNGEEQCLHRSQQFDNRLFDRDTLLLSHYDINFLFVLALYSRNNSGQKMVWKEKVRLMFREHVQKVLNNEYEFYAMQAKTHEIGEHYINEHFKDVLGRIYATNTQDVYSLALDRELQAENKKIRERLSVAFDLIPCNVGDDMAKVVSQLASVVRMPKNLLLGCIKNDDHLDWIRNNEKYNVRLESLHSRPGAVMPTQDMMVVQYIVLYRITADGQVKDVVGKYKISDPSMAPMMYDRSELINLGYPKPSASKYLIYEIEEATDLIATEEAWKVRIQSELDQQENDRKGSPILIKEGERLI